MRNSITQNKITGPINEHKLIKSQIDPKAKQNHVIKSKNRFGWRLLRHNPVSINSSFGIKPYYLSFLNFSNYKSAVASKQILNGMIDNAM